MNIGPEFLIAIVAQIFTAGAIYGAIRADLRNTHAKAMEAHDSAKGAHQRLDNLLLQEHGK